MSGLAIQAGMMRKKPGGAPPATYYDEVIADSPLAYWRLGESSGTTANDATGNARNGTYAGVYTLSQTGLVAGDTAAAFTKASSGRVEVIHGSWLNLTAAVTVEAWVKYATTPSNNDAVVSRAYDSDQIPYLIDVMSGVFRFGTYDSGSGPLISGTTSIVVGTTYHVVGVKDATHYRIYVNGVEEASTANTFPMPSNSGILGIAHMPVLGRYSNATIDEVAIYGTALSAARILAHYNAGT